MAIERFQLARLEPFTKVTADGHQYLYLLVETT
jgi:hypothetical protein